MSPQLSAQRLGYLCGIGGLVGVNIGVVLKRRRWLNSAGLLLIALGLMQLSLMLRQSLGLAVTLPPATVIVQLIAAIRGRMPWDGGERRGGGE